MSTVYLVAAVFFKQLPLEFSAILGKLLPAITGGANLMLMGVYSYLSETTAEADRTMRFGIFAQIVPLIPIASIPWSGFLFQKFRYISERLLQSSNYNSLIMINLTISIFCFSIE